MSGRKRFFVENTNYPDRFEVVISGDEFVHAKCVQRVEVGSEITLLDGSGKEYSAIVSKIEKHFLTAHITSVKEGDKNPKTPIYALIGALKGDKTELVVQKACELGVGKIGVFSSKFCAAYLNENKLERLKKISRESAKQCLRSDAPSVEYFKSFETALLSAKDYKNKIIASEYAKNSDIDLTAISGPTAVVVGSEGGFSEGETELAKSLGFASVTLGKRILRAETAAIATLTLAAYFLGELK